jgi:hypothetical protein
VLLRDHFDPADNAGIQRYQILGGNPVLKDRLTPDLVNLVTADEVARAERELGLAASECAA